MWEPTYPAKNYVDICRLPTNTTRQMWACSRAPAERPTCSLTWNQASLDSIVGQQESIGHMRRSIFLDRAPGEGGALYIPGGAGVVYFTQLLMTCLHV